MIKGYTEKNSDVESGDWRGLTIEPSRKIVIHHVLAPKFDLTITMAKTATGTQINWEQVFEDYAVANTARPIVEPANQQNLNRWAAAVGA